MSTRLLLSTLFIVAALGIAACGGDKADPAADATKVADQPPQTSFDLIAKDNKFNQAIIVAKADTDIKVSLKNDDGGVVHNIAIYTDSKAKDLIWRGELFQGVKTVDETFKGPPAGIYFFRCDAHPDTMTGSWISKEE